MTLKNRNGFSLLEAIMAAMIIAIMLSLVMPKTRVIGRAEAYDAAVIMAAEYDRAMATAVTSAGKAILWLNGPGKEWATWATTTADTVASPPTPGHRNSLGKYLAFGSGNAAYGPFGDPASLGLGSVPFSVATCDAWGQCVFGSGRSATIYIQAIDNPDAVAAVVVTSSGTAEAYRYQPANGSWE